MASTKIILEKYLTIVLRWSIISTSKRSRLINRENIMSQAQIVVNRFKFNAFVLFDKSLGFSRKDGCVYYYNDGSMLNFFAGSIKVVDVAV